MKSWNNLDILRAFAVLLVAFAHLALYTHHGQRIGWLGLSGVCLFFVHTSLVLMWSLEREPHTFRFYIRRIFRLYPLWLVILGAVVALHVPIAPPAAPNFQYLHPSAREVLANALLVMNLTPGGPRIVGASWSLPVEAQMYLLLPFLFFFARSQGSVLALLIVDALAFVSVWAYHSWSNGTVTLASSIPYFLPGVMAYVLSKKVKPVLPGWTFGVALLAYAVLHARFGSLPVSAFFCLAVGVSLPFFKQITWRPLVRSAHYIAKYSYGIYLCHIPAICVGLYFLRHHSMPVRIAGMLFTVIAGPVVLYHLVEEPLIRLGTRVAARLGTARAQRVNEKTLELEPAP